MCLPPTSNWRTGLVASISGFDGLWVTGPTIQAAEAELRDTTNEQTIRQMMRILFSTHPRRNSRSTSLLADACERQYPQDAGDRVVCVRGDRSVGEKRTAPDRGTRRTENFRRTPMDFSASPVARTTGKNPAVSFRWPLGVPPTPTPSEVEEGRIQVHAPGISRRTTRSGSAATRIAPLSGRPPRLAQWRSLLGDRLGSH